MESVTVMCKNTKDSRLNKISGKFLREYPGSKEENRNNIPGDSPLLRERKTLALPACQLSCRREGLRITIKKVVCQRISKPTQKKDSLLNAGKERPEHHEKLFLSYSVGTSQYVNYLMLVQFLKLVACRSEIIAGIELSGFLGQHLAYCGCHGKPSVTVDIYFADSRPCCPAKLIL